MQPVLNHSTFLRLNSLVQEIWPSAIPCADLASPQMPRLKWNLGHTASNETRTLEVCAREIDVVQITHGKEKLDLQFWLEYTFTHGKKWLEGYIEEVRTVPVHGWHISETARTPFDELHRLIPDTAFKQKVEVERLTRQVA